MSEIDNFAQLYKADFDITKLTHQNYASSISIIHDFEFLYHYSFLTMSYLLPVHNTARFTKTRIFILVLIPRINGIKPKCQIIRTSCNNI
jgi:hypothetical protein